jgi:hypothetical protein
MVENVSRAQDTAVASSSSPLVLTHPSYDSVMESHNNRSSPASQSPRGTSGSLWEAVQVFGSSPVTTSIRPSTNNVNVNNNGADEREENDSEDNETTWLFGGSSRR